MTAPADYCEGCGRTGLKPHRTYKGHWFCGACYKRLFKRALCPKCGEVARLYSKDPEAICTTCRKSRPCIRCGKEKYAIGKITLYGPVCNACAHYYNEPKPCGHCGELSLRLTRVKKMGIDVPVCDKCANRHKRTCQGCRFPRELFDAPDGRRLCKKCLAGGEVTCPICGEKMAAGRGKKCLKCALKQTLNQRLQMSRSAFEDTRMADLYCEFGTWLEAEVGVEPAVHKVGKFLTFFMELEKQWGKVPDYPTLLAYFGAEGLRRVRLPMRWLSATKGVVVDAEKREEHSELRRIDALLNTFPKDSLADKALQGYYEWLSERRARGRTSLRSVRLALRPAVSLLLVADDLGDRLPLQEHLEKYLREQPGQAAALTGFAQFLLRSHGLMLSLTVNYEESRARKREKLAEQLLEMMRSSQSGAKFEESWIRTAFAYFHQNISKTAFRKQVLNIQRLPDGTFKLSLHNNPKMHFWLPSWDS